MRNYTVFINETRLLISPPEVVYDFLEKRATRHEKERFRDDREDQCDEELGVS